MLDADRRQSAKIGTVELERIREFRRDLQRESAERVEPTPHGVAILSDSIPDVYDHNYVSVEEAAVGAAALAAEADAAMEDRHHRRVIVEQGAPGLAGEFLSLGYVRATHLVLAHTREPDRRVDTSTVEVVPFERLEEPRREAVLAEQWGDEEIARQLRDAKRHIQDAVPTTYFAAVADGEIAGWCELRSRHGVAQIEDVEVLPAYRGRGLGRAVVQAALDEGRRTAEVLWLEALADDWPRELYGKLGFTYVDARDFYTKLPHPLTRVRLRTSRLELRVPTIAEARRLYAGSGLDEDEETFVRRLASPSTGTPDRWRIDLAAFEGAEPVGVQSIWAEGFTRCRDASTSSSGADAALRAEMHAGIRVLGFDLLGAETIDLAGADAFVDNEYAEIVNRAAVSAMAGGG